MITQEKIRGLFDYDSSTGLLISKQTRGRAITGEPVGTLLTNGYLRTFVDKKSYYLHRLAFLHYYGYMPEIVDHINRIRTDNRIVNLRECTKAENIRNSGLQLNNKTGFKGVFAHQGKWTVRIAQRYIGIYNSPHDAARAYDVAAVLEYGEFAVTNKSMGLVIDLPDYLR